MVFVVGEGDGELPDRCDQLRVRVNVELIAGLVRSRKDADRFRITHGIIAGILKSLPGALQKDALLGIEDLRLCGGESEQTCIEQVHIGNNSSTTYEIREGPGGGIDTGCLQLGGSQIAQGLAPSFEIVPELERISRIGKAARNTDDSDCSVQIV